MYERIEKVVRQHDDGSVTVEETRVTKTKDGYKSVVEKRRFEETCKYEHSLHPTKMSDILNSYAEYLESLQF